MCSSWAEFCQELHCRHRLYSQRRLHRLHLANIFANPRPPGEPRSGLDRRRSPTPHLLHPVLPLRLSTRTQISQSKDPQAKKMVARKFLVRHYGAELPLDYDTSFGLEVLKFQIFSLTSVLPDEQKVVADDDEHVVNEGSDLGAISEKLRLLSIEEEPAKTDSHSWMKNWLESCRRKRLLFLQLRAYGDGCEFEHKILPYVQQVLMYQDLVRQEAARKLVSIDELEKALVSLVKDEKFKPSKHEKDHVF